ncbi:MAG: hypothetical protein EOP48_13305 [Sphingobacteriales bacterium]|nr:MAG: hypothetical protein EOP48_13305 [Sphingobacteriales bacterium]
MNIAYVCYHDIGTFNSSVEDEESILLEFLKSKGMQIERVVWNDSNVNWEDYDLAILKSPWDYFELITDFYNWLDKLKKIDLRLLNPVDIVKWNADKHYLKDISNSKLAVIPTIYLKNGDNIALDTIFEQFGTNALIVKPCVSGGSFHTFKVNKENQEESIDRINNLLHEMDLMVQPFLKEIETTGEWSLLFFNGEFSHGLVKRAKSGDFRVQHYLGGSIYPQKPANILLRTAKQYVDQFAKGCLYARVDGVIVNGRFLLMELELIEPFLFLFTDKMGYENYYKGLMEIIDSE